MKLKNIEFGKIWDGAGVRGFCGEGYPFHKLLGRFAPNFNGMTFVSKTTTLFPQKGNLALRQNSTPKKLFPDCIKAKFLSGAMLNAVGLSNFGLTWQLADSRLRERTEPWMLSIMPLASTRKGRMEELRIMRDIIELRRGDFRAPIGIQQNSSCPNTEHNPTQLIKEWEEGLNILGPLVPNVLKVSIASAPISAVMELNKHPCCDAICVSNTLPFGWEGLDWGKLWGTTSPLAKFGGGGLSGKTLQPLVCEWISRLRDAGFTKPINGGGGIFSQSDVHSFHKAGASSVFITTVAVLRPWRVEKIIRCANSIDW